MCTGTCWIYKCVRCGGTILKDTSVSGHTCNAARRNRSRGCCRTGIEFTFYDKDSDEKCGLCEIAEELFLINAESDCESCDSSFSGEYQSCVSVAVAADDDDGEGGQEEGDEEREEENEDEDEDEEEDEEGGAKLTS